MNLNFTAVQKCNSKPLFTFYTSIFGYSLGVCLFYTVGSGCGTLQGCMGPPCLRWGEGANFLVVCQIFCPKFLCVSFLYFSARNLNFLHVVESPPDLLFSLGQEVNENVWFNTKYSDEKVIDCTEWEIAPIAPLNIPHKVLNINFPLI